MFPSSNNTLSYFSTSHSNHTFHFALKVENLEDLLKEKDAAIEAARTRLSAIQAHQTTSEGTMTSLEEAIADKDKQIQQLREQRDRAEQELKEECELHEREVAGYKMKSHAFDAELEKLQVFRLSHTLLPTTTTTYSIY